MHVVPSWGLTNTITEALASNRDALAHRRIGIDLQLLREIDQQGCGEPARWSPKPPKHSEDIAIFREKTRLGPKDRATHV
jgi:hypothetical protein